MGIQHEFDISLRRRVEIFRENYYLTVGKTFVSPTVPRENDPTMTREREIIETICQHITELLEELNDVKSGSPDPDPA
jgi:hypothetical protein